VTDSEITALAASAFAARIAPEWMAFAITGVLTFASIYWRLT